MTKRIRLAAIFACAAAVGIVGLGLRAVLDAGAGNAAPAVAILGRFVEVTPPRPLPDLALSGLDGRPAALSAYAGRPVLLNLWATWCSPCVKEMPALDRLQAQSDAGGLQVVTLSVDRGGAVQVKPFLDKLGVQRPAVLLDPSAAAMSALTVRGLPTTLLLDTQGREIARYEGGAEWDAPAMMAEIRRLTGG